MPPVRSLVRRVHEIEATRNRRRPLNAEGALERTVDSHRREGRSDEGEDAVEGVLGAPPESEHAPQRAVRPQGNRLHDAVERANAASHLQCPVYA